MEINKQLLKIDLDYWDWVAPNWADAYVIDNLYINNSNFCKKVDQGWESQGMYWHLEDENIEVINKPVYLKSKQFLHSKIKNDFITEFNSLLKKYNGEIRVLTDFEVDCDIEITLKPFRTESGESIEPILINFGSIISP